ncbi:transketolase [Desulfocurvibacter africanus PCS]|uniref:Transketolase n=1 Tax=Desulfocurvibacter africanus PCS TaxID=1262666 RepID=M5PP37_DESAF|nr:transketolase [Desulfocurvibacter africanus]EMG35724.1 transketolase [Desulfocurvibacter africanus PCS]
MPTRRELANAIRALSMDAIQKAKSGHPGAPLGMADIAEVLWNDFLRHNPANPSWHDRDRFVFSNGHGSMLLYALLHLSGYDLTMEDLKRFRQLGSRTPGHPERGVTPGVESTSGPLGQGIAMAVGMAMAERMLAATFNRDGFPVVDHYTYVFMGDGCMMEGLSHETCSLAGTLGLGKLIAVYDDNGISIDGRLNGWFADDTPARFEAYGWHVVRGVDGHDAEAVRKALEQACAVTDKPSLVCCKTIIGYGAPTVCGTSGCHGSPLGEKEIAAAREFLGWKHPPFEVPQDIYAGWDAKKKGSQLESAWAAMFKAYEAKFPELAAEFVRRMDGDLPVNFDLKAEELVAGTVAKAEKLATRVSSKKALDGFGALLPELFGASADLTPSNGTFHASSRAINAKGGQDFDFTGNYLHCGVREFAMAALQNGMTLHGGFIPYGGTFLVFSDYMRNAIRLAALMKTRTIFVLTHDSIGVGEDGPTHQPVEHTASLRLIPDLDVWRPCDAVEATVAWKLALERRDGPSAMILSRQDLPHQGRDGLTVSAIARGGYILQDCQGTPEVILVATGSEVGLAVDAAKALEAQGRKVRVVSMPCVDLFERQPAEYRELVLPTKVRARVALEAGVSASWHAYAPVVVGMDRFGESAPGGVLFPHFGFTVEAVLSAVTKALSA